MDVLLVMNNLLILHNPSKRNGGLTIGELIKKIIFILLAPLMESSCF